LPILRTGGQPELHERNYRSAMTQRESQGTRTRGPSFISSRLAPPRAARSPSPDIVGRFFLGLQRALHPRRLQPRGEVAAVNYGSRATIPRRDLCNGAYRASLREFATLPSAARIRTGIINIEQSRARAPQTPRNARIKRRGRRNSRNNDVAHSDLVRGAGGVIFAALIRQSFINPTSCPVLRRRGGIIIV